MAIYDNRICKTCGITFSGGPRSWYCPNCRMDRSKKANLDHYYRKKWGNDRKIGSTDICQCCGGSYTVKGSRQKYCENCNLEMLKKVDNEQGKQYYHTKVDKEERSRKRRAYYSLHKDELNLKRRQKYKNDHIA